MGMSIDEALEIINHYLDYSKEEVRKALLVAINIMRKYQQIEHIVSDFREYQKGISCGFGGATYMQMVSEVVEDGNDK